MKIRTISALLILTTVFMLLCGCMAENDSGKQESSQESATGGSENNTDSIEWELTDGTLTISGNGAMADRENGYEDKLWYSYSNLSKIKSIVIKDGVTSIGQRVFTGCSALKSVTIPESVTSIGTSAFFDCESLESVTLPSGITSIGSYAFSGTALYNTESNWEDGVLYIGEHLIRAKSNLLSGSYTVKDGTKTIAASAFLDCKALTGVTIPDSVTFIGKEAFCDCDVLENLTIQSKDCEIADEICNSEKVLIRGYAGSTAEQYANKYNCEFEAIKYA